MVYYYRPFPFILNAPVLATLNLISGHNMNVLLVLWKAKPIDLRCCVTLWFDYDKREMKCSVAAAVVHEQRGA